MTHVDGVTCVVVVLTVPNEDAEPWDIRGWGSRRQASVTLTSVNETAETDTGHDAEEPRWLTLPDVAEQLGVRVTEVRRMLKEGDLVAVRRGERAALSVPADFLGEDGPLPELRGTFTVLSDGGFSDEEIVEWMFTRDERLVGGTPIGAIRGGAKTEVRRRAMEEAL